MIVVYALWALQLLISAALLAKVLAAGEEKKLVQPNQFVPSTKISECERLENLDKRYHCSELEGGVVSIHVCCFAVLTDPRHDRGIFILKSFLGMWFHRSTCICRGRCHLQSDVHSTIVCLIIYSTS